MAQFVHEHEDIANDLKATLAARRELGPDMDDELVELLLARVDSYIDGQVASQIGHRRTDVQRSRRKPSRKSRLPLPLPVIALLGIAGFIALGVLAVATLFLPVVILVTVFLLSRVRHVSCGSRQL